MSTKAKVLFIGLDSAEPQLLLDWIATGDLPVLRAMQERGVMGRIAAPVGFGNGVFWPSFFTGVNPAKHGRYFCRQVRPGTYQASMFREDTDFKRDPMWAVLSRADKRVAVIDMVRAPLTKDLNGIQLVDWMTHDRTGPPRSWPPDLVDKVIAQYGDDTLGGHSDATGRGESEYIALCNRMLERVETKTAMSCDFLGQGQWDLFMTVYADPHDIGHQCWHLHDPSHPRHDAALAGKVGDPIKNIYRAIDRSMERLIQAAGPEATVIMFTGPGMGPGYTSNFLLDQILRRLESGPAADGLTYVDAIKSVYRSIVPHSLRNRLRSTAERSEEAMLASDRRRRKFFSVPHNENSGAIKFNVVGREPDGKVRPGPEAEAICDALIRDLKEIVKLDTDEPLVEDIVRVHEKYHGEHVNELPDLLVIWNRKTPITAFGSPKIGKIEVDYPGNRTGDHTPRGLLIACGPGVLPGTLSNEVSVMDVGATVLSWLGSAMPDADGAAIPALCRSQLFGATID